MPRTCETLDLEELVITLYAALDDALTEAGLAQRINRSEPIIRRAAAGLIAGLGVPGHRLD
ncbi:MAG TPA: hypothetical protein VMY35_09180, partial [Phycisphaerae bacterium]|nr:hypothetical protein [Phycisphaerae bacterium]